MDERISQDVLDNLKQTARDLWGTDANIEPLIREMDDDQIARITEVYRIFNEADNGIEEDFQATKQRIAELEANISTKLDSPKHSQALRSFLEENERGCA